MVGIAAGILSAVTPQLARPISACRSLAFVGISSPAFLTALLGLYFFSVLLRWAPSGGMLTPGAPFSIGDLLAHLILPACLLSIGHAALIMRYMRASLLEVLNQDYVRTARAKGVKEFWVIIKHARAQRAAAGRHPDRLDHRHCRGRRDLHRERLQLAGHGPAAGQCRRAPATIR